jgi:hypothetical protein
MYKPNGARREYAREALAKASWFIDVTEGVEERARDLNALGFQPLDALHLASAEEAQADFFCTCDDKFLKKARSAAGIKIKLVSPVELIEAIEQ